MKKLIRALSVLLLLTMCLTFAAAAEGAEEPALKAVLSAQKLTVDGAEIACEKYNINGSNYFKLRDLAYLLRDTGSRFAVGWDGETKTVTVTSGEAYAPDGTELVLREDKSAETAPSSQTIVVNGAVCDTLTVYNIGGNNFFQLRQLGALLGFDVDYNGDTNTALIATAPAAPAAKTAKVEGGFEVTAARMPKSLEELKIFDLTDEYQAAAAIVCTLALFETDFDAAWEMLDYVMGPEEPSEFDRSFIREQMKQYPYVMRSYFAGATPENDYAVGSAKLMFMENVYSRSEENSGKYVTLYCQSSGADSARGVKLRQKKSTGEWFLFSDTYKGLMTGIVQPLSADPWA